jgi:hypothetical protein
LSEGDPDGPAPDPGAEPDLSADETAVLDAVGEFTGAGRLADG